MTTDALTPVERGDTLSEHSTTIPSEEIDNSKKEGETVRNAAERRHQSDVDQSYRFKNVDHKNGGWDADGVAARTIMSSASYGLSASLPSSFLGSPPITSK